MSIKRLISILLIGVALLTVTACDANSIRGSGDLITESRDVSNFDSIALSGSGDVIVIQGEGESLNIETDDNLMEHIEAEVQGGILNLGFKDGSGSYSPTRLVFTVGINDLKSLRISGSGEISSEGIQTDRLDAKIDGSGEISLSGEAAAQDVDISGSGKYQAADLQGETVVVKISGSGEATVWVTDTLETDISGSGSVDYYGSPQVSSSGSGSGDVNSRGEK